MGEPPAGTCGQAHVDMSSLTQEVGDNNFKANIEAVIRQFSDQANIWCDGIAYLHQVGTHRFLGALLWVRATRETQSFGKWEENATSTGGDRWDGGR